MKYSAAEIQKMVSPNPFGLLTALKPDGTTNIMAVSWWSFVSNHPAMVAVCLSNKGYSGTLIRETSEFVLNIVGENLKESAFRCGTCSGRDRDKASEFGIELAEAGMVRPQLIKEHKVAMECRLVSTHVVSDHTIYVGEIVESHCDKSKKQLYAFEGYGRLDTV